MVWLNQQAKREADLYLANVRRDRKHAYMIIGSLATEMPEPGEWWPIDEEEIKAAQKSKHGESVTASQFVRAFGAAFRQ